MDQESALFSWLVRSDREWAPRYGLALLLIAATALFLSLAPVGRATASVAVLLLAGSLVAALRTTSSRALALNGAALGVSALVATAAVLFFAPDVGRFESEVTGAGLLVAVLFISVAPIVIAVGVWRDVHQRRSVTIQALLGVMAIYLLIGILFAFVYGAIAVVDSAPFYSDGADGDLRRHVYFSFVTLTTLGYGDLAPALTLGRTLAITQALLGQIYLVTIVGVVVGNLGGAARVD